MRILNPGAVKQNNELLNLTKEGGKIIALIKKGKKGEKESYWLTACKG